MYLHGKTETRSVVDVIQVDAEGSKVDVTIASARRSGSPLPLRVQHILTSLYETILAMSTSSRFVKVSASMAIHGRVVGSLQIRNHGATATRALASNVTDMTVPGPFIVVSGIANGPFGTVINKDDQGSTVEYAYNGAQINSKGISLTILNVLLNASVFK